MKTHFSTFPTLIVLILTLGLALSVCAQGQSPTTPRERPTLGSGLGGDSTDSGQASDRDSGTREPTDREPGSRPDMNSVRPGAEDTPRESARPGPPKPAADRSTRVVSGATGAKPAARSAASSGAGTAGSGAIRFTKGGEAVFTVVGNEPFQPSMEHPIEYPEIPEEGEPITLEGPMPLQQFLMAVNVATGWNILVSEEVQEKALGFFMIQEVGPKQALEMLRSYGIYYEYDIEKNELYLETTQEWLQRYYGRVEPEEFVVKHANIAHVESILTPLLSPGGRMMSDQRTGRIYLWDTPDNIEQMSKMISELDIPLEKAEFLVQHTDIADIEGVLAGLMSPNGSILADPRTGQVFAWDSPSVLDQMQIAVNRLDVPVESHTFEMQHVNAENIIDGVESLISERGMIQVDPRLNALIVTDLPRRIAKIQEVIETLDRELEARTWTILYADLDFLADQIESLIPDEMGEIIVHEDVHQLTVRGLPSRLDQIDALIKTWDIKRQQVLIEAYIVEVGESVEREFNINWSYFGNAGNQPLILHGGAGAGAPIEAAGTGETMSIGQLPFAIPLRGALELDGAGNITRPIVTNTAGENVIDRLAGNNLAVMLDYLDQQNKATILSSPRVTVQDGEEAIFENATRVPYVSASSFLDDFSGNVSTNRGFRNTNRVEFIDVGTILSVLPRITQEDSILLEIDAEDSTFVMREIVSNDLSSTVPEKTVRRAQTQLRVQSAETIVIGGLRRDRASESIAKTPLLGDIPVLGRLFRNPSKRAENNTLLLFLTTTITTQRNDPESGFLAGAEERIADSLRHNSKTIWGRMEDRATQGGNELGISIGPAGDMHSEGKRVTLDQLRERFFAIQAPGSVKVVIRRHPRAPEALVTELTEAALEASLKVEFDDSLTPVVPKYYDGPGTDTQ